jgi:hypothetical protein
MVTPSASPDSAPAASLYVRHGQGPRRAGLPGAWHCCTCCLGLDMTQCTGEVACSLSSAASAHDERFAHTCYEDKLRVIRPCRRSLLLVVRGCDRACGCCSGRGARRHCRGCSFETCRPRDRFRCHYEAHVFSFEPAGAPEMLGFARTVFSTRPGVGMRIQRMYRCFIYLINIKNIGF